ncbi:unnamed protein product [Brachionus calyciflorus]|uniref:Uncharacterized protein n=1 Tax=Brachionus calyciflorus TaxID=104777 RepID=A0A813S317_9BILA|nr:unnamed protein product [Brachionus calyciflorus]
MAKIFSSRLFKKKEYFFRSIQYGSWWYGAQEGFRQGCFEWNGNKPSDHFPQTLEYVYKKTGFPIIAHNKFWDIKTVYAKKNGGSYDFILDSFTGKSLPDDQKFWDDLFLNGTKWGLKTYEQDWMNHQNLDFTPLMTDISLGRRWLNQMGNAAAKFKLTIQYSMSLSRHVLQSLENDAVTQIRVTNDYSTNWDLGGEQWRVGVSSILSSAVGLMPFKDVYCTTPNQPNDPYGNGIFNSNIWLDSVVSILTAGPVGLGDKIEYLRQTLIIRSCNDEGLLLKPSKPVTALDIQIHNRALGAAYGPDGEVWSTYSTISNYTFGIIFAADIKNNYNLKPEQMGFKIKENKSYFWLDGNSNGFKDLKEISLTSNCTKKDFCLFHVTPNFWLKRNEIVLFGEKAKWIPISPQRVSNIRLEIDSLQVDLSGVPDEKVIFYFAINLALQKVECNFKDTKMTLKITDKLEVSCD